MRSGVRDMLSFSNLAVNMYEYRYVLAAHACTYANGQPWTGARFLIGSPPAKVVLIPRCSPFLYARFYALSSGINSASFPVLIRLFTRLPSDPRRIIWRRRFQLNLPPLTDYTGTNSLYVPPWKYSEITTFFSVKAFANHHTTHVS